MNFASLTSFVCLASASINIWGPRSLKSYYTTRSLEYSVANFGFVPYGRTVYGTVVKAHPIDACTPLMDFALEQDSPGPLIALVERGTCHFAQKVLNAQRAGASMVLIGDSLEEDVEQIILYENNRELVNEIAIPSLLIPKRDAENFLNVIDSASIAEPITLAVDFALTPARHTSRMRLFLQVDSAVSFDALLAASLRAPEFGGQMKLQTFYKIFDRGTREQGAKSCLKGKYCVVQESEGPQEGLAEATQRQLCLLHGAPKQFAEFARTFRADCFNAAEDPVPGLAQCSALAMDKALPKEAAKQVEECAAGEKGLKLLKANVESTSWDVLSISPLVYINDHLYRGSGGDSEHLMVAFCASFERAPAVCERIGRFEEYKALRALPLSKFVFLCSLIALFVMAWAVSAFYFIYREKMKATYNDELNTRVARAIGKYMNRGADSYAEFRHVV